METYGDKTNRSLVTAGEVANLLGVTTSWVYEQSRLGRIPTVTLGRYRRYRIEAIEAWIEAIESGDRVARGGGQGRFRGNGGQPQRAGSLRDSDARPPSAG